MPRWPTARLVSHLGPIAVFLEQYQNGPLHVSFPIRALLPCYQSNTKLAHCTSCFQLGPDCPATKAIPKWAPAHSAPTLGPIALLLKQYQIGPLHIMFPTWALLPCSQSSAKMAPTAPRISNLGPYCPATKAMPKWPTAHFVSILGRIALLSKHYQNGPLHIMLPIWPLCPCYQWQRARPACLSARVQLSFEFVLLLRTLQAAGSLSVQGCSACILGYRGLQCRRGPM